MPQRGARRTTKPKPAPVVNDESQEPIDAVEDLDAARYEYRDEYHPAQINVTAIFMVIMMVAMCVMGYMLVTQRSGSSDRDRDRDRDDRRRPVNLRLADDLADAMDGPNAKIDAQIFSLTCKRYAERLDEEFRDGAGLFDTKQELINLTGIAAYFMTAVEGRNEYRDLPRVLEDFHKDFFDEESGAATDDDREKLIEYFRELQSAFEEVGGVKLSFNASAILMRVRAHA